MKVKTSVALSPDLLLAIEHVAGATDRSVFIERVLRRWLGEMQREDPFSAEPRATGDGPSTDADILGDEFSEDDFAVPRARAEALKDERYLLEVQKLNAIADGKVGELWDVTEYSVPWYELGDDVEILDSPPEIAGKDAAMKVKTSVTLSPGLIAAIDACTGGGRHRSELLEELAWEALRRRERAIRTERDIALINLHADFLNSEAEEFLTLQADVWADETDAAR